MSAVSGRLAYAGRELLALLFSSECLLCGRQGSGAFPVCGECISQFRVLSSPRCGRCGRPFAEGVGVMGLEDFVCGSCRATKLYFDRAVQTFRYDGLLRDALGVFKYSGRFSVGQLLGRIWAGHLAATPAVADYEADAIVPVPVHRSRLREREFNQSAVLAVEVGRRLGVAVRFGILRSVRRTASQTGLSARQRRLNVRGAFGVGRQEDVSGRRFLLIDDVFTTGATTNECAKVLKRAGAASVVVATLCTPSWAQIGEALGEEWDEEL